MEIQCPKCKAKLGKVVGKSVYLNSDSFVTGTDYQIVVKCDCGEVASLENQNGTIEGDYGKESKKQKPAKKGSSDESSDSNEGEGGDSGETPSGGKEGSDPEKEGDQDGSDESTGNRKWTSVSK